MSGTVKPVRGLNCPGCGAALTIRTFEHSLSAVCPQCLAVLDTRDRNLRILQGASEKTKRVVLKIPLGKRGKWRDTIYEVVGFQQRTIHVDGEAYSWGEYLLFNPYSGFRYLTEYENHWNDVRTLRALPLPQPGGKKPVAIVDGRKFQHFQTAQAQTTFVLGEFPWRVKVGETVQARDYTSPPFLLSSETTEGETVWSMGEYADGKEIYQAFQVGTPVPPPNGIFANQPNPHRNARGMWRLFWLFVVLSLAGMMFSCATMSDREIFKGRYRFTPGTPGEASFVTPVFEVTGRPANVELSVRTDLSNNWAYFSFALINDVTGDAYDFGREVSYYFGRDSDGNWSEGDSGDTVYVPAVPAGRYYLRVEPEMAPGSRAMDYEIELKRDVPRTVFFWLAILFLSFPPLLYGLRSWSFENKRWQESDYAASSSGDD
jgi:hypothetical protein